MNNKNLKYIIERYYDYHEDDYKFDFEQMQDLLAITNRMVDKIKTLKKSCSSFLKI